MDSFEALGFAFRPQYAEDYGIDAHAELIEAEHPTGRLLGIQLKSGPSYFTERQGDSYVFRADRTHVEYWTDHCLPVLVCLCDVDNRQIYWQVVNRQTAISTGKEDLKSADEPATMQLVTNRYPTRPPSNNPSSPSEDYLTVLAGQRQWIAATNFAGCPGRPPDSFANSAVLNYLGKVPDALGWPIDPCFPVQIDPKAEQFEQVVAGAYQRPFAVHLLQSPQQELPESPALLDLAEYRLHSLHPQSVALPTPPGL